MEDFFYIIINLLLFYFTILFFIYLYFSYICIIIIYDVYNKVYSINPLLNDKSHKYV